MTEFDKAVMGWLHTYADTIPVAERDGIARTCDSGAEAVRRLRRHQHDGRRRARAGDDGSSQRRRRASRGRSTSRAAARRVRGASRRRHDDDDDDGGDALVTDYGMLAARQEGGITGTAQRATEAIPVKVRERMESLLRPFPGGLTYGKPLPAEWGSPPCPKQRAESVSAAVLIEALDGLIDRIDGDDYEGAKQVEAVSFMLSLPSKLGEILPEAKEWLTDRQIMTKDIVTVKRSFVTEGVPVPLLKDRWKLRPSGLLLMLRDVLQRNVDQLHGAAGG
eukprot:gene7510-2962_t